MDKKYRILEEEFIEYLGRKLYRIEALRNFADVKKGDKGSWIEKEDNLSHEKDCWVYGEAKVVGRAFVLGNAKVYGYAEVREKAKVFENAQVFGDAQVYGYAKVFGNTEVFGDAQIYAVRKKS